MRKPVEKLRSIVLVLIFLGVGCLIVGHVSELRVIKNAGLIIVAGAVLTSLIPLLVLLFMSLRKEDR
jgi:hypothetical protein